ncbi:MULTISPECIES: exodeoxyribonuclease V subunit alpha [Cobetia]|uniref:exodeoxyribonuclease V subunit alpha n=1 Tax=Cobetia TaxID=204286 RepID=UPI0009857667|nr:MULTISPECIES: exodeoxyribonuclease V subunit alpha [Cobetia]POR05022.1 exodeoxyribonuclease V subunit alpha [Cobetia sp. MM1IDA2H-1]
MSDATPLETQQLSAAPDAPTADTLLATLGLWVELGWLRRVDAHLVRFMARHVPEAPASVLLAAALASHQLGRGHVCLSLSRALAEPRATLSLPPLEQSEAHLAEVSVALPEAFLADLDAGRWAEQLAASRLVSVLAQADSPAGHLPLRPLVLVGERLYLRRYWQAEREVAAGLRARMGPSEEGETRVSDALGERLRELFASNQPDPHGDPDWQKLACALALRQRLTVISGGPGTGKTTTVTRLLALLQAQALAGGADGVEGELESAETAQPHERRALDIRLVAPTGKAAARLSESIRGAVAKLEVPDAVRAAIPREASTVHRLLGARPDSRHFRHHAGNPLALDLLVVDEASMVDLDLMAALLGALPAHARLILLGDKDQLASVEAGAVLGDLCEHALPPRYSPAVCADLARLTGETLDEAIATPDVSETQDTADRGRLADHVVVLQKSYRFSADSGIGALARACNAGDRQALRDAWKTGYSDIAWLKLSGPEDRDLETLVVNGYRPALEAVRERRPAREVIDLLLEFQLLCALRRGPYGVDGLNQRVARVLMRRGLIAEERGWYAGRPVMVTRNDRALGLYNGDVGITLSDPAAGGRLRVFFPVEEEVSSDAERDGQDTEIQRFHRGVRAVLPSRLEAVETVFAMTVHKSQGSEFRHVVFVLPEGANPILTRELVYTGITRAKSRVTLAGTRRETLEGAIERRVVRASGLVL